MADPNLQSEFQFDDLLTGMSQARVDDRHRVAIPAKYLDTIKALGSSAGEQPLEVIVSMDINNTVAVWPKRVYSNFVNFLRSQPSYDPRWEHIRSQILGSMELQKLDKQNRVRIPGLLAKKFNLADTIVIQGADDRLRLMSKQAWDNAMDSFESYVNEVFPSVPGPLPRSV